MASPISTDNFPASARQADTRPANQSGNSLSAPAGDTESSPAPSANANDRLTIESASLDLNPASTGRIDTPDQAKSVIEHLRSLFAQNPENALASHSAQGSSSAAALLASPPVG